jgi:hypothetical protein
MKAVGIEVDIIEMARRQVVAQGRWAFCPREKDRRAKTCCTSCGKSICADHQIISCPTCRWHFLYRLTTCLYFVSTHVKIVLNSPVFMCLHTYTHTHMHTYTDTWDHKKHCCSCLSIIFILGVLQHPRLGLTSKN